MTEITSEQIKEKIEKGETFLLDYFAHWCGPCKMLMPYLESVESELNKNNISIFKYNVESDMSYSTTMGIRGVPTLQFYKNGKMVKSQSGLMNPNQIKQFVEIT